ncbi:MAG: family 16 glycosylhydrolase [Chitinophagaceae bacterium]
MKTTLKIIAAYFFMVLFFPACKKGNGDGGSSTGISISNTTQYRSTSPSNLRFLVTLDKASTMPITVNYTTIGGSALANKDFKPSTGVLTIPSNQLEGYINVEVTGDSTRRDDQLLYIELNNAANATLVKAKGTGTIINANGLYFPVDNAGYSTPLSYPGYTLAWNDEFNNNQIDLSAWTFEQGKNNGWGNNELQNYTGSSENAFISAGNLVLEARRESAGSANYTSARMITKGKKVFKFGRIDIRAKSPKGKGIWPALWMLGNNIDAVSWPACGEIDILELLGHEPNKIYGTMHWGASVSSHASKGTSYVSNMGSFDQQFHVYSIIWVQDSIKVLIDDQTFFQFSKTDVGSATYPFNADFFFIFNIAVGGNWPGSPDSTTEFPQRLVVDYVRVFQ